MMLNIYWSHLIVKKLDLLSRLVVGKDLFDLGSHLIILYNIISKDVNKKYDKD